ncbi:caspase-8-like isoform X2 [Tachysurus fulvidraco]|nr:caspase-8-like isoform X2 [Tachysurus fulvidraco]XP_047676960.1 caspase-8-like isoform X2 [Tachysurus fulvidraco]
MESVRKNKVFLIDTLSADASICLQHAESKEIITRRDYKNLNHPNHTQEKIIINLLDILTNKGDEVCRKFLKLLEEEEVQKDFPQLKKLFTPDSKTAVTVPETAVPVPEGIGEYKMSSMPRGVCLIINNMKFDEPRRGSEKDEESLTKVFEWLGFTVEVYRDQTAEQMKDIFGKYSKQKHEGDCFVCCILSHGNSDGVQGTDGKFVQGSDIFDLFNGTFCPSLINKPKVFFIQACRGKQYHQQVKVQSDGHVEENAGEEKVEEEEELEADAVKITIPAGADVLVARSTVKGYLSFRQSSGSWFIQCLCEQLKMCCQRGEDIQSILLKVNDEVSRKAGKHMDNDAKQMPVQKVTLRKKLVFRVPQ